MSKGRYSADASQKAGSTRKKAIIAAVCVFTVILIAGGVALVFALLDPLECRMAPNVTIAGLEVGGMTKPEARKALKSALEETLYTQPLTVALPEQTLSLSPADTGVKANIRSAVNAAYQIGRSQGESGNALSLTPYLSVNEPFLRSALEDYASRYDTVFLESRYALTGDTPALGTGEYNSNAPCQTLELTVGVPEAHLDVEAAFAGVLSTYGEAVAKCRAEEYTLTVSIPPEKTPQELDLDAIWEDVCVDPVDDSLDMKTYEFVHGSYGYRFDRKQAKKALSQASPGETVSVPMEYVQPEILGDGVYFRDVLGECETKHGDNENRNTNLRLLCEALDGMVIQPGETFSYNEALGERTAEKGYKPAPAYSGNQLTNAIGGGVCQGSSTLYNCVLLADLEVVQRFSHGALVSYLPLGLDATVNWGTTDFQFRNNFHFPIKIEAETTEDLVKMKILGTDEKDYYIVMTTSTDTTKPDVIYAVSYKNKYSKETGELISKDREAYSTYNRNVG